MVRMETLRQTLGVALMLVAVHAQEQPGVVVPDGQDPLPTPQATYLDYQQPTPQPTYSDIRQPAPQPTYWDSQQPTQPPYLGSQQPTQPPYLGSQQPTQPPYLGSQQPTPQPPYLGSQQPTPQPSYLGTTGAPLVTEAPWSSQPTVQPAAPGATDTLPPVVWVPISPTPSDIPNPQPSTFTPAPSNSTIAPPLGATPTPTGVETVSPSGYPSWTPPPTVNSSAPSWSPPPSVTTGSPGWGPNPVTTAPVSTQTPSTSPTPEPIAPTPEPTSMTPAPTPKPSPTSTPKPTKKPKPTPKPSDSDDVSEEDDTSPRPTSPKPTATRTTKPTVKPVDPDDVSEDDDKVTPKPTKKPTTKPTTKPLDPDDVSEDDDKVTPKPTTKPSTKPPAKPTTKPLDPDDVSEDDDEVTTKNPTAKTTTKPLNPDDESEDDEIRTSVSTKPSTPAPTVKKPSVTAKPTSTTKAPSPTTTKPTPAETPKTPAPTSDTPAPTAHEIVDPEKPNDDVSALALTGSTQSGDHETSTDITFKNDTHVETYKKYDRGDKQSEPAGSEGGSYNGGDVVLGGRNRNNVVPGADVEVSVMAQHTQGLIRFTNYGFTVISTVLLMLFHMIALYAPEWLPARRSANTLSTWLTPNSWELLVVFGFYQHVGSLSMLELTKAPYFVLDFTDSFSWTNLNVYSMGGSSTRRLDNVILTGMVAYADRLGVDEDMLLAYTTRFFFVFIGLLLLCFFAMMLFNRLRAKKEVDIVQIENQRGGSRNMALCFIGLAITMWMLSTFPLTAVSSYELYMQSKYGVGGGIAIVLFNLLVVVLGGLAFLARKVYLIRTNDAMEYRNVAVFGTLYVDMNRNARFFFVAFVCFQVLTGVMIGVVRQSPSQLTWLLVVHGFFLVGLAVLRPYFGNLANVAMGSLTVLRILNFLLATSFQTGSDMSTDTRGSIANALVIINFIVLLAIFFRQFLVFIYVLRTWQTSDSHNEHFDGARDYDNTDNLRSVAGSDDSHHIELESTRQGGRFSDRIVESTPPPQDNVSFVTVYRPIAMPTPTEIHTGDSPVPNLANRPPMPQFKQHY